jgi:hypothetical protein
LTEVTGVGPAGTGTALDRHETSRNHSGTVPLCFLIQFTSRASFWPANSELKKDGIMPSSSEVLIGFCD